jgi:hypothetical protein
LNKVLSVDDFNHLWNLDDLFLDDLNFSDVDISGVDLNDLFDFDWNLLDDFLSDSDFNNLFNVLLNDFVNLDQLRNNGFEFDNLVFFDHLFNDFFNLNNSWDFDD